MRRSMIAIVGTVVGLWLVLSFKSSALPAGSLSRVATSATTATTGQVADTAPATVPPAGPPPPPDSAGTTPSTSAPASGASGATRTVNGDVVSTRYGDVQVAVVLQGTQIVDVKAIQLPFDRPRSQSISDQAGPWLHDEVLQAQSAHIDAISGATYTSDAYARSLQAALDKARA